MSVHTHAQLLLPSFPAERPGTDSWVEYSGWAGYSGLSRSTTWWARAVSSPCWQLLLCCLWEELCPSSCPKRTSCCCRRDTRCTVTGASPHRCGIALKLSVHRADQVLCQRDTTTEEVYYCIWNVYIFLSDLSLRKWGYFTWDRCHGALHFVSWEMWRFTSLCCRSLGDT